MIKSTDLHKAATSLLYCNIPSPFTIENYIPSVVTHPNLGLTQQIQAPTPDNPLVTMMIQVPQSITTNKIYQYVLLSKELQRTTTPDNHPLSRHIYKTLWSQICCKNGSPEQCIIWESICNSYPDLSFPNLIHIFLSILHHSTHLLDTDDHVFPN